MDDVQTTFQSRLSSRLNRLSQKLNDNAIRLSGTISDCIKISLKTSPTGDIISRKVEDIDVVPVVFPALKDIPLKKVTSTTGMYRDWETDRKSTRLNSSHSAKSRMPSSA